MHEPEEETEPEGESDDWRASEVDPAPVDDASPFVWEKARRPEGQPIATRATGGRRSYLYRRSVIYAPDRELDDHRPRR